MGRVNQLWQDERDRRWQEHYDNFMEDLRESGDDKAICARDAAEQYANDMMEEEDD